MALVDTEISQDVFLDLFFITVSKDALELMIFVIGKFKRNVFYHARTVCAFVSKCRGFSGVRLVFHMAGCYDRRFLVVAVRADWQYECRIEAEVGWPLWILGFWNFTYIYFKNVVGR